MPMSDDLPCSDKATFVADITIPDGTVLSPGQSFAKIWRMLNSGTSTWGSGYQLVFVGGDQMGAASAVSVPSTAPGSTADISVSMTAPSTQGTYQGNWRMRNAQGVFFGDTIWVKINVVSPTSNDHIAAFTADPPSPSSASTVRLYAKINWWPQFRAMRVRVDNQTIGETATTEYTFDWGTGSASRGDHTIVLEVADQTDTSWNRPERRVMIYTLEGDPSPTNHAPNRPSPSSPYDWYVYYSGNTAQLCAQANGDPDGGDAITGYYFDIYDSAQLWNSGWVGGNCVTTGALGPYNYQWRVKVRDSHGAESDWSDSWHFTIVNPNLTITELYFEPQDSNSEQVKIRACTEGQGGVGITMRVSVNDANDGSGNGTWHIIKELGVPCFNEIDAPIWNTLEYGDGPHRVRAEAHGASTGWDGAAVREEVYTLPHRRPASTRLLAPVPPSGNIREAIYLNSRTITFRWEPTIRASNYTLHVSTNLSPKDDPDPVFRQTLDSSVTQHTVTFSQDYPTLYWQVSAANDAGTNASGDQLFGIDRVAPFCTVQTLPATTFESVFQVSWDGSDNLAGTRTFDIQHLDSDRGTWSDWLTGVPSTKTYELFTGQPGHIYAFRCRAMDNANNTGDYPANADTSTKVDPAARPQTPWWDSDYSGKRNFAILNNMPGTTLPIGYPVHLHFDSSTTPTAAELYNASQSNPKCNDLRIVYDDTTELDRVVQNCNSTAIDVFFRTQVQVPAAGSDSTSHQLYYGNGSAASPPADLNNVWYPSVESQTRALLRMQEGTGTIVADSSGYGNNCTFGSGALSWTTGKFGARAIRFPGHDPDGAALNCGNNGLNLSAFTIEAWIKRNSLQQGDGRLAGQLESGVPPKYLLRLMGDELDLVVWPCTTCGASGVRSNRRIQDTNWHHVAVTFDGGNQVAFYIDGSLDSVKTLAQTGWSSSSARLQVGGAEDITRFDGIMSFFRLSTGQRTAFPYGTFAAITNEPTTAVGDPIDPPVTGSPDLAMLSLDTYPNPGGGVLVQAIVQNWEEVGTQNGFYTDLYADHQPTGPGDLTGSIRYWVASPIEGGTTLTLATVLTEGTFSGSGLATQSNGPQETTRTLYVQVDSTGVISEPDKANNISPGIEVCFASADSYESDDTAATARFISVGTTEVHNFDVAGDQDWFKFSAETGLTYTIRTENLGLSADTYLYLYDTDGTTLLTANDDHDGTLAAQITWQAPADGTYYVLAQHWNPNVGGCGTNYDFSICDPYTPIWQPLGPPGGPVYDVALSPELATDHTLFVATAAGAYRSTDDGQTWDNVTLGKGYIGWHGGISAQRVVVAPGNSIARTVFVRGPTLVDPGSLEDLLRSTDNGGTWKPVPVYNWRDLLLSPDFTSDGIVLVTLSTLSSPGNSYYISTDGGTTWQSGQSSYGSTTAAAFSPDFAHDCTLLAVQGNGPTRTAYLARSTDAGRSWQSLRSWQGIPFQAAIAFSPDYQNDQTILADLDDGQGIVRSTDGGTTWNPVTNTPVRGGPAWRFAFSPFISQDHIVYATSTPNGYLSTDAGASWMQLTPPPGASQFYALEAARTTLDEGSLFAATDAGLYRGTLLGTDWVLLTGDILAQPRGTLVVTGDQGIYRELWFANGQLWHSRYSGYSWETVPTPEVVHLVAVSPSGIILIAGNSVWKSTDQGHTWVSASGLPNDPDHEVDSLGLSPDFDEDGIALITRASKLYRTTDAGSSWQEVSLPPDVSFYGGGAIVFSSDFTTDQTVFFAGAGAPLLKSTDGGVTWQALGITTGFFAAPFLALAPGYASNQTLFLASKPATGSETVVCYSTDGGATWNPVFVTSGGHNNQYVSRVSFASDYPDSGTVYLSTNYYGILASYDRGSSWMLIRRGWIPGPYISSLPMSSPSPHKYLAADGGVWQFIAPAEASCILVGDLDSDGDVDVKDIMLVASCWRCRRGDQCYNEDYDIDRDDDIDIVDIMLVVKHWGETCP